MNCIDTHSHIYGPEFDADRDEVVARAQQAGVSKIFLPNINEASVAPMMDMCRNFPGYCYPMIGLHPEDVDDSWVQTLDTFEAMLENRQHPFIAIGEVGLDYYWDRSRYDEQKVAFARQIGWAVKFGLPLMIHTREAHREVVECLQQAAATTQQAATATAHPAHATPCAGNSADGQQECVTPHTNQLSPCPTLKGVFHCFGDTTEQAEELLSFEGFMLGIGGIVTFKKSSLPDTLKEVVPLERIVIETDSPYLAPTPHRGKRNESAFVCEVAKKLAEIYDASVAEVCEITTANALRTFPRAH